MACPRHGLKRTVCLLCSDTPLCSDDIAEQIEKYNKGKRYGQIEALGIEIIARSLICHKKNEAASAINLLGDTMRCCLARWFEKYEFWGGENQSKKAHLHLNITLYRILGIMMQHDITGCTGSDSRQQQGRQRHSDYTIKSVLLMMRIRERAVLLRWKVRNPGGWRILNEILNRTVPPTGFPPYYFKPLEVDIHRDERKSQVCRWSGTIWPHQMKIPTSYSDTNDIDETKKCYRRCTGTGERYDSLPIPPSIERIEDLQPHAHNRGHMALQRVADEIIQSLFLQSRYWEVGFSTSNALLCMSAASRCLRLDLNAVVMGRIWMEFYDTPKCLSTHGWHYVDPFTRRDRLLRFINLYKSRNGGMPRIGDLPKDERSKKRSRERSRTQADQEGCDKKKYIRTYKEAFEWICRNGYALGEGESMHVGGRQPEM